MREDATICALSTPIGVGGLAVIRVSGPEAILCCERIFKGRSLAKTPNSSARHGFIIDPEKIGYETCAFIGLNLKNPENFDEVVKQLKDMPEVVECHYTTGNYDLFIKIYARNNHHLLNIIHDKLQPMGLARSESIISFHAAIDRQMPTKEFLDD